MYFFLDCVPPTNELIIGIPHFYCMVFYFQSFFLLLLFLKTFIFLSPLFLCSCMLSVFLIRILAIFIIVVLNFWCYISNSFAISDCSPVHHVTSILISKKHGQTVCGQVSSVTRSCLTLCNPVEVSTPGFPVHQQLPKLAQTHVHQAGDAIQHLILCHPLLLLPSIFHRNKVFSSESVLCIRWPKYWSFSFSISPSNEYSWLISLRIDWLDLLAVQGTLKSLLQHHSSRASILQHSAFFIVQLSHPCMITGKTIALTRWTLVGKILSLLFNMLSRLVITFLPRSKCLFISWLQSPSAVIWSPPN